MPRDNEIPEGKPHVWNVAETRIGERSGQDFSQTLTEIWQKVLGLPRVGLDDNFFESGGTSLLATVLISKLNEALRQEDRDGLPIASIFEHPTLRAMSALVLGKPKSEADLPASQPLAPVKMSDELAASSGI